MSYLWLLSSAKNNDEETKEKIGLNEITLKYENKVIWVICGNWVPFKSWISTKKKWWIMELWLISCLNTKTLVLKSQFWVMFLGKSFVNLFSWALLKPLWWLTIADSIGDTKVLSLIKCLRFFVPQTNFYLANTEKLSFRSVPLTYGYELFMSFLKIFLFLCL